MHKCVFHFCVFCCLFYPISVQHITPFCNMCGYIVRPMGTLVAPNDIFCLKYRQAPDKLLLQLPLLIYPVSSLARSLSLISMIRGTTRYVICYHRYAATQTRLLTRGTFLSYMKQTPNKIQLSHTPVAKRVGRTHTQ